MTTKIILEEHERRFVPDLGGLPFDWSLFPTTYIRQGYLEDELRTRVRDEMVLLTAEHSYTQTRKTGSGVSRPEDEENIAKEVFDEMWETARKCSLEKTRYHIHFGGIGFQLNIFHGDLHGYHQIEIEFDSHKEAVAFVPPVWFGREVTEDSEHGNYTLAKFGKPKE
jgi:CYTH domain-containing protein